MQSKLNKLIFYFTSKNMGRKAKLKITFKFFESRRFQIMKTIRYQLKSLRKSPAFIQKYSFISSRTTTKDKYKKTAKSKRRRCRAVKTSI